MKKKTTNTPLSKKTEDSKPVVKRKTKTADSKPVVKRKAKTADSKPVVKRGVKVKRTIRTKKTPTARARWGIVGEVNSGKWFMDYLTGRYVKILPTSSDTVLQCIVLSPGYEGVKLMFTPDEVIEVPHRPSKDVYMEAYKRTLIINELTPSTATIVDDEDEPKQKTKRRKAK
jgi:hypothetical protein